MNSTSQDKNKLELAVLDFQRFLHTSNLEIMPVIVQHAINKEVLMIGYINAHALEKSCRLGRVVLWSRKRNALWDKGATSGDVIELKEIRLSCEQNSLLFLGLPKTGSVCHTIGNNGRRRSSCFYRVLVFDQSSKDRYTLQEM